MWNLSANLSAVAAKAKQAAASIERQLDDSIGLNEGAGGGDGATNATTTNSAAASSSAAAATASSSLSATNDDFGDEDDFFSEDLNETTEAPMPSGAWQQQQQQQHKVEDAWDENSPVATKLDATADEGDDFFAEEDTGPASQRVVNQQIGENGHGEVDFGGNDVGGGGWADDVNEIPLDDDDQYDDGPVVQQEQQRMEDVQEKESNILAEPRPEPVMRVDEYTDEADVIQPSQASPDAPMDDIGPYQTINGDVAEETNESVSFIEAKGKIEPHSNNAEIVTKANVSEELTSNNISQEDHTQPADIGYEHVVSLPPPKDDILDSQPLQTTTPSMDDAEKRQYLTTIAQLETQLFQREDQLASKSDQIASLSLQHESDAAGLRRSVAETKEEARKRVVRARDRVEEMRAELADAVRRADAAGGSSTEQSGLVSALRAEGEQLARKQSAMEQSVRNAKGEARELREQLNIERDAREKKEARVNSLEEEVKSLKEGLTSARKGESQSKKLEGGLVAAKEESEKQRASNLVLDQQVKELKEENKSLKKEVGDARTGAALELEGESNKLRKERDDMLGDLESKLRRGDREANVREDALRHEVSELRKRWQDAVRRAEDLSMDVQHSTAPLLRQLESTERQSRSRAAAWAELETKLRSDLEDHVIQLEKLTKERHDLIASDKRSKRLLKEKEEEIASSLETIDAISVAVENLETKVEELEEEGKGTKQELAAAERRASEGASKVRSEMLQAVVDDERRHQSQTKALEEELDGERLRRENLERQLDELAQSASAAEFARPPSPAREKRLRSATDQASILHDTLVGIDSDVDDEEEGGDNDGLNAVGNGRAGGSFAAMEQLSLGLKGAKVELEALRKQLASSEETRESLLEELGDARVAVEKLPLFEQKVSDLTMEVKLKEMELRGLQDDIADVRFLYRTQLDALLEEKVVMAPAIAPSSSPPEEGKDEEQGEV